MLNFCCVGSEEIGIPFGLPTARDHGDGRAGGEVGLPVCEVDDHVHVVPGQCAGHTSTNLQRINGLDVVVWSFVDLEESLSSVAEKGWSGVFWDGGERARERKALREDDVAAFDDGAGDGGFVGGNEGVDAAVDLQELEDVAGAEVAEDVFQ